MRLCQVCQWFTGNELGLFTAAGKIVAAILCQGADLLVPDAAGNQCVSETAEINNIDLVF